MLHLYYVVWLAIISASFSSSLVVMTTKQDRAAAAYDYDLIVIGAGASGMFAAGTASMLGSKTLLLEQAPFLGGDCTNAACVPSKAIRSVAKISLKDKGNNLLWNSLAQQHKENTVAAVQAREDPMAMAGRNPNLDLWFVDSCCFSSSNQLKAQVREKVNSTTHTENSMVNVSGKKFLIATGASPTIMPSNLEDEAQKAGLPLYTYRSVLGNSNTTISGNLSIWTLLQQNDGQERKRRLVIAGGGPTACELGQSLARLSKADITIVAPTLLPHHDVVLREAAMKLLVNNGIKLILGRIVAHVGEDVSSKTKVVLLDDDGETRLEADAMIACTGRSPNGSLSSLNLQAADVKWCPERGVLVKAASLQSVSAPHVYACGDCCSAATVHRSSAHAGWMGFHAARNTVLPRWFLVGSRSTAKHVPRVIYTDPVLASVGLSYKECLKKYGMNGFLRLHVPEEGMDRADMDRLERPVNFTFVELRACKQGNILGMTACGPAAAELANEVGFAMTNGLSVRDMARALHSYPSHGYMLHRIALAMATSNTVGLLAACGPLGRTLAAGLRFGSRAVELLRPKNLLPWTRKASFLRRRWESRGVDDAMIVLNMTGTSVIHKGNVDEVELKCFLDVINNRSLFERVQTGKASIIAVEDRKRFAEWLEDKPS